MAIEKFFSRPYLRSIKIQTRESFDLIFVNYGSTAINLTADLRVQELTAADGYQPLSWVDKNAISAKQPLGIIEWPKLVKRDSLQTSIARKEPDEVGWILDVTPRGGKPVRHALQHDKVYFAQLIVQYYLPLEERVVKTWNFSFQVNNEDGVLASRLEPES